MLYIPVLILYSITIERSDKEMKVEIEKAVNFLSNMMRCKNPTADQLVAFRSSLSERFTVSFTDHWFPERPLRGNAYRCVRIVNNRMDKIVVAAGGDAGFTEKFLMEAFPSELSIWIDPDEVSYRIGEDGSVGIVYSIHEPEEIDSSDSCSSTSSDDELESRYSPVPSTSNRIPIINPSTKRPIVLTTPQRTSPQTVNEAYLHMMS